MAPDKNAARTFFEVQSLKRSGWVVVESYWDRFDALEAAHRLLRSPSVSRTRVTEERYDTKLDRFSSHIVWRSSSDDPDRPSYRGQTDMGSRLAKAGPRPKEKMRTWSRRRHSSSGRMIAFVVVLALSGLLLIVLASRIYNLLEQF